MARVFQHHVRLAFEIPAQMWIEPRYRLPAQRPNHILRVALMHMPVANLRWLHQHQRSCGAQPHAPGAAHVALLFAIRGFFFNRRLHLVAMLRKAARAHAHIDLVVELRALFLGGRGNLVELFDVHCIVHLSSCCVSSAASI